MKRRHFRRWLLPVILLSASCSLPTDPAAPAQPPATQQVTTAPSQDRDVVAAAVSAKGPDWLHVPEGFTIELVAGPPLVERPIMASFDDRGRLFVADSSGVNLRGPELQKDPPHRIVMLEDVDGDGRFDKSHVFADKLVFPQGLLWHDGAVFVASPPGLWRLEDTNRDGVCDERKMLIGGFPITGVSDDMHGACLGPDGRIYTGSGRFPYKITSLDGRTLGEGRQPVLVRCLPDGAGAEVVSGTQGNPVEMAFTDEGEPFVSGTFYGGTGMRDALIHVVEGGDFPVLGQPQSIHWMKSTGDLLPPLYHMIATAPSGLMRYDGDRLSKDFENNLFCAYFNTHKVMRHVLQRSGATFSSQNEDFLTSTNADFHPTDVLQDADGSLLVVDTGGWFRIGCPTSVTAKPDIKGAIYRIRRSSMPKVDDPRGLKLAWDSLSPAELAWHLGSDRPAVREHAISELAKRSSASVPWLAEVLTKNTSAAARRNAVWALTRIDRDSARSAVQTALNDADESVRQSAVYSVGLYRSGGASKKLLELLASDSAPIRREAATALGRIGAKEAVPALLSALGNNADRYVDHAAIFALIRIADAEATFKGLSDPAVPVRHGALIALDQMGSDKLTPDVVRPLLDPAEPLLQKAALQVIGRHADWGDTMRSYFRTALSAEIPQDTRREDLKQQLIAFANSSDTKALIAERLRDDATSVDARLVLLETVTQVPTELFPEAWGDGVRKCLASTDDRIVRQAVLAARAAPAGRKAANIRFDPNIDFADGEASFGPKSPTENFAARWTGLIRIPAAGHYKFTLESDDGSRLFIDDSAVVNNPGQHPMQKQSGDVQLSAGDHDMRVDFFQAGTTGGCRLLWDKDGEAQVVPATALFHRGTDAEPKPGLSAKFYRVSGLGNDFPELGQNDFDDALMHIARDDARPAEARLESIAALAPRLDHVEPAMMNVIVSALAPAKPALLRSAAADTLARVKLSPDQRRQLIAIVAQAGPMEMPKLLAVFENDSDAETGRQLVAALQTSVSAKSLRPEVLSRAIGKYPEEVRKTAEPMLSRPSADLEQQKARIAELEASLIHGEPARGREIFYGTKAACSACHTIQSSGGQIGPDLSKIGSIRTSRDLLEAIAFPSASFARGFEPVMIKTREGDIESGIISRETADAIYLTTGPREVKRLPRSIIADVKQGTVSIMPQGLDAQLSRQELSDVIAFLGSLK